MTNVSLQQKPFELKATCIEWNVRQTQTRATDVARLNRWVHLAVTFTVGCEESQGLSSMKRNGVHERRLVWWPETLYNVARVRIQAQTWESRQSERRKNIENASCKTGWTADRSRLIFFTRGFLFSMTFRFAFEAESNHVKIMWRARRKLNDLLWAAIFVSEINSWPESQASSVCLIDVTVTHQQSEFWWDPKDGGLMLMLLRLSCG